MEILEETLKEIHDWSLTRIQCLSETYILDDLDDAESIHQEFSEWLNPNIKDHDIISLEYIGEKE